MEIRSDRDIEQPQQGLDPAGKHQQGEPQGMPGIGKRGTDLRVLDGIVLMDMVKTLEEREEEIPRKTGSGVIVSKTRGNGGRRDLTRDSKIRQERSRLNNLDPRNRRREIKLGNSVEEECLAGTQSGIEQIWQQQVYKP
jgi:hypothetical protein